MFIKDIFTASEVSYKKGYAVCSPMAKSFKGDNFFRHGHKYGQYLKILVGKRKASRLTSPPSPTACVCVRACAFVGGGLQGTTVLEGDLGFKARDKMLRRRKIC